MKLLLIGSYPHDRLRSMEQFTALLADCASVDGIEVRVENPPAVFGALKPSPTGLGKWLGYLDKFILFPHRLQREVAWADVVHVCDHSQGYLISALKRISKPVSVTCHDLLAVRSALGDFPENPTGWTGRHLQRWILNGLKQADRALCVSSATRDDFLRLTAQPEPQVVLAPPAIHYPFSPAGEAPVGMPERYFLHVGGDSWYKNRAMLFTGYRAYCASVTGPAPRLVVVGPSAPTIREEEGILFRSGISEAELMRIYSHALGLVFPSIIEGFGWPIIEAQACGIPVAISGREPMWSVAGGNAVRIAEPMGAGEVAAAFHSIEMLNPTVRAAMVEQGFANVARYSRKAMIEMYRQVWRSLARTAGCP
jgi:glycosyltransferase involved in cell wall biosynthesis